MRKINKEELVKYFDLAISRREKPDNYDSEEDLGFVKDSLVNSGFINSLIDIMNYLRVQESDKSAAGTLWITGFQMGREYESRHQEELELMKSVREEVGSSNLESVSVPLSMPPLELRESDVLVCALKADVDANSDPRLDPLRKDNLVGYCSACKREVVYRPTAPTGPTKMCTECVFKMKCAISTASAGEVN